MTIRTHLPPGPRWPRALATYLWLTKPTRVFDHCAERYGRSFTLRLLMPREMVYFSDPELVKSLFTGDPAILHAGEAYEIMEPTGGPRSLFLLDEEEHLRMRKLLLAPLHGERLQRWRQLVVELTERELERWPAGRPFALRPITEAITLDVIMKIVFGIEPQRAKELRTLLPKLFEVSLLQAPAFVIPALRRDLGPWSPWGRYMRLRARVDELLYAEIARRRAELDAGEGESAMQRGDVLSLLLDARDEDGARLSDAELRDQLVTMLLAGHETTASSLAWAFERLVHNPDVMARLVDELADENRVYLNAVIKETLRSRPVGAHVARRLQAPLELGGYTIPAGTVVAAGIYALHHDPVIYPEPASFRPERFLGEAPEPYAWIPFGGGVRRCIGVGLATLEMQEVLATVLGRVKLRAPRQEPEPIDVLGVTLVPGRGAEVMLA